MIHFIHGNNIPTGNQKLDVDRIDPVEVFLCPY